MVNLVTALKPRRTQGERSAATRTRLLDATIDCLFELGYAGTTTTVIAERAGVSRGAQLHHFPTKSELVTKAVEHILERRLREFREAFARVPAGVDRENAAIDILWSMVSGPTFYAWLELVVAARTDAELRTKVAEIGRRFFDDVERTYHELFPTPSDAGVFARIAPHFTFALLEGLALDGIMHPDDPHHAEVLNALKLLASLTRPVGSAE
jgi:AcrR family transcriptional regulator